MLRLMTDKTARIAVLGSGTWGLSTALHLTNAGFMNITVFDRASQIPSHYSAGHDLNKIVRPEYEDPFYTELALAAINGWKTPLFGPYYHNTGYVVAASGKAPQKAMTHLQEALASIKDHPVFKSHIKPLSSPQDFKDLVWQFTGTLSGFRGYVNHFAGYAHSSNAIKGIHHHLAGRGVRFVLGPESGKVVELVYTTGETRRCSGIRTADDLIHTASTIISCLGAHQAELIPSVSSFSIAKCWSVAHVQLTDSECDLLRGIPVLNVRDLGFFFEPDPTTKLLKLCPLGAGFINTDPRTKQSLPPPTQNSGIFEDYIPASDEEKLRRLLRETLPWLADRPFVDKKMCWFADTADSEYCIDFVPDTDRSLIVMTGDSGHGFKMMPIAGMWVLNLLKNGQQELKRWQWRNPSEHQMQPWGDSVSWRIGTTKEIREVIDERGRMLTARI